MNYHLRNDIGTRSLARAAHIEDRYAIQTFRGVLARELTTFYQDVNNTRWWWRGRKATIESAGESAQNSRIGANQPPPPSAPLRSRARAVCQAHWPVSALLYRRNGMPLE